MGVSGLSSGTTLILIFIVVSCDDVGLNITSVIGL